MLHPCRILYLVYIGIFCAKTLLKTSQNFKTSKNLSFLLSHPVTRKRDNFFMAVDFGVDALGFNWGFKASFMTCLIILIFWLPLWGHCYYWGSNINYWSIILICKCRAIILNLDEQWALLWNLSAQWLSLPQEKQKKMVLQLVEGLMWAVTHCHTVRKRNSRRIHWNNQKRLLFIDV